MPNNLITPGFIGSDTVFIEFITNNNPVAKKMNPAIIDVSPMVSSFGISTIGCHLFDILLRLKCLLSKFSRKVFIDDVS